MSRSKLSVTKLTEFHSHCLARGWSTQPTKGEYEVLRMSHPDKVGVLLVHRRMDDREHLTLSGHSAAEFDAFAGVRPQQKPTPAAGRARAPDTRRQPADTAPWE